MTFELVDDLDPAACLRWDQTSSPDGDPVARVLEDRRYYLVLKDCDPTLDYCIKVGEEWLDLDKCEFGNSLEFERDVYFESASGPTDLFVCRRGGEDEILCGIRLYVLPTKIGTENYRQMVRDLQAVCRALTADLVGKSRQSQELRRGDRGKFFRSHEEELAAVRKAYSALMPVLAEIKAAPISQAEIREDFAVCGRVRSSRGILAMMKRGIDPRKTTHRKCRVGRIVATHDVAEQRLLKAFLGLIVARMTTCRRGIKKEIAGIEQDRKFRSMSPIRGEPSLYDSEDVPRIRKLHNYDRQAEEVLLSLRLERQDSFWEDVSEAFFIPDSAHFAENAYYLKAANIILRYIRDDFHWGKTVSSSFMAKKSSRMYEQWVLIQIVTAFEKCGLSVQTWDEVVRKCLGSQFGLDFKKNTVFRARLGADHYVSIRYEPWILPNKMISRYPGETLCHMGSENSFWNPDYTIELIRAGSRPTTVYAITLDAKYSRKPSKEMRNNVEKYLKIRAYRGENSRPSQVTHQVWLVYPGDDLGVEGIYLEDDGLGFSCDHGVVFQDTEETISDVDFTTGEIVATPNTEELEGPESDKVTKIRTRGVFDDFARGTLAFFKSLIDEGV